MNEQQNDVILMFSKNTENGYENVIQETNIDQNIYKSPGNILKYIYLSDLNGEYELSRSSIKVVRITLPN